MSIWTASNLRAITGGAWLRRPAASDDSPIVESLSTDTRAILPGQAFLALRGERFDAHDYLDSAAAAGASLLIIDQPEKVPEPLYRSSTAPAVLRVNDTRRALGQLAAAHRSMLEGTRVIAVVGSNGKTTTAKLIHAVLSMRLRGTVSPKSFNNDVGVPLTILGARRSDQYLICEVGSNHPGETAVLGGIVRPDIVVVTSIGRDHIEFFPNLAAVAREHAAIFIDLRPQGTAIVPANEPLLADYLKPLPNVITFGKDPDALLRLSGCQYTRTGVRLTINDRWSIDLPLLGEHNALNAIAAAAVGKRLALDEASISAGLTAAEPADMRLNRRTIRGVDLLIDCYNSNPDSLAAAVQTFIRIAPDPARRVLFLGDMLETGEQSESVHREAAERIASACPAREVILIGGAFGRTSPVFERSGRHGRILVLPLLDENSADLAAAVLRPGDAALLKGSRGLRLERIVAALSRSQEGLSRPAARSVSTG